jgi:hypothetical protein
MTELEILPGRHCCNTQFEVRMFDCETKNKIAWIIYGYCRKCSLVIILSIIYSDTPPIKGVDFVLDDFRVTQKELPLTLENMEREVLKYARSNSG